MDVFKKYVLIAGKSAGVSVGVVLDSFVHFVAFCSEAFVLVLLGLRRLVPRYETASLNFANLVNFKTRQKAYEKRNLANLANFC